MTIERTDALDWQNNPLQCAKCKHQDLLYIGACGLQHACVGDRCAWRIDRFFQWNPGLAKHYLEHPYFEVRAIAARHTELVRLPKMLGDPDGSVRWSAAQRLPRSCLHQLVRDPEREVRIQVAMCAEARVLELMLTDPDDHVRIVVARRLPAGQLVRMIRDTAKAVRIEVARRIGVEMLQLMLGDCETAVREVIAARWPVAKLAFLMDDKSWRVRRTIATRAEGILLERLLSDSNEDVRLVAVRRNSSCSPARPFFTCIEITTEIPA